MRLPKSVAERIEVSTTGGAPLSACEALHYFEAVDVRQVDVDEDDVRVEPGRGGDAVEAGQRLSDDVEALCLRAGRAPSPGTTGRRRRSRCADAFSHLQHNKTPHST